MSASARHYDVILSPVITEKTTILSENNQVVFEVPVTATKVKGKTKRFRGIPGRRNDIKKAIVTLKSGDEIDIATGL